MSAARPAAPGVATVLVPSIMNPLPVVALPSVATVVCVLAATSPFDVDDANSKFVVVEAVTCTNGSSVPLRLCLIGARTHQARRISSPSSRTHQRTTIVHCSGSNDTTNCTRTRSAGRTTRHVASVVCRANCARVATQACGTHVGAIVVSGWTCVRVLPLQ